MGLPSGGVIPRTSVTTSGSGNPGLIGVLEEIDHTELIGNMTVITNVIIRDWSLSIERLDMKSGSNRKTGLETELVSGIEMTMMLNKLLGF